MRVCLWFCAVLACGAATNALAVGRGVVIADFESGSVALQSYPGQDADPEGWALVDENTHDGSAWSLRLTGNTWKIMPVAPVALTDTTVWQVAVFCEDLGEMHAFGVGDGQHELFYTAWGEDLPPDTNWWTVYQGAFPRRAWHVFLLPLGEDWQTTFGYAPTLDRLFFVNDDDADDAATTLFDTVVDVTGDLPHSPRCRILYTIDSQRKVAADLYQVGVQFHAEVFDPDSDTVTLAWDFGDSTGSDETDPVHEFLVHASYPYTVSLAATDPDGLAAGDTCQVEVDPGAPDRPLTVNFVGDIMTGRSYEAPGGIIDADGVESIFAPTLPILGDAADVSVANLEVSYTDRGTPHPTKSVVFRSRPENLDGIRFAGIDLVTIGNNHIIDYGEIGMLDTMAGLDERGIRYSGAGVNEYFALLPCYWTERGVRLAFLGQSNRTGRQWNYQPFLDAGYDKPGFAYELPANLEKAIDHVRDLADVVIVQTHSGDEYQITPPDDRAGPPPRVEDPVLLPGAPDIRFRNEPTPGERELRRLAVDLGADVLINHHPHVLQGFESYHGKLIMHSLGNFVFDLYYPETMPTLVLTLEITKDGIVGQRFAPAWIDRYIPRPATGQLAREIIDRMADYSRPMNALVVPDYAHSTARVLLARDEVDSLVVSRAYELALVAQDGWATSAPVRAAGDGYLSGITSVTGDGAGWEVRWGREILWHGGFEAEGASLWDINTSDEWLDTTVAHDGTTSLALRRDHDGGGQTGTDLIRHLPCDPAREHSAGGWLRTENAGQARTMVRFYDSRGSESPLSSTDLADPVDGTTGWTYQWRDLATPSGAIYFELRAGLEPPSAGSALAWYDDLALVEWEPWQPAGAALAIAAPNNQRYLQVRCGTPEATSAVLVTSETVYDAVLTPAPDAAPVPARPRLTNQPNPFNPRTTIVLDLPAGASVVPVTLAVFDLRGHRVATLYRGDLAAGRTHGFTWDGRDESGRGLASGAYFARAEMGETVWTRKLLLVR